MSGSRRPSPRPAAFRGTCRPGTSPSCRTSAPGRPPRSPGGTSAPGWT